MSREKAKLMVAVLLKELSGQKGFDHWYDRIDTETKEELLGALTEKAEAVLSGRISEMPNNNEFELLEEEKKDEDEE